jgi:zinc D-Ala-D-Ala carboxypeptidase
VPVRTSRDRDRSNGRDLRSAAIDRSGGAFCWHGGLYRWQLGAIGAIACVGLGMQSSPAWAQTPQFAPPSGNIERVPSETPDPSTTEPKPTKLDCSAIDDEAYYGHLPYAEAPRNTLASVGNGERLRSTAARSFRQMQSAAAKDGVYLIALSGFRDRTTQTYLFYSVARQRGQSLEERARVSAPPGYSEHHTGYAIDIGDEDTPSTDLSQRFENTEAWEWLTKHAHRYGFEMSFPRSHPCVSYEPWHWRWVGDLDAQQMFQAAQELLLAQ